MDVEILSLAGGCGVRGGYVISWSSPFTGKEAFPTRLFEWRRYPSGEGAKWRTTDARSRGEVTEPATGTKLRVWRSSLGWFPALVGEEGGSGKRTNRVSLGCR